MVPKYLKIIYHSADILTSFGFSHIQLKEGYTAPF